jgi:hypothetical protein
VESAIKEAGTTFRMGVNLKLAIFLTINTAMLLHEWVQHLAWTPIPFSLTRKISFFLSSLLFYSSAAIFSQNCMYTYFQFCGALRQEKIE